MSAFTLYYYQIMNNQITAVDQNATGEQNAVVYQNAPVYQPVPVYQSAAVYQNAAVYQTASVSDQHMQQMINTNAAMDYAGQVALAQNMALRPSNTKKAYDSRQIEWRVCQRCNFCSEEFLLTNI